MCFEGFVSPRNRNHSGRVVSLGAILLLFAKKIVDDVVESSEQN